MSEPDAKDDDGARRAMNRTRELLIAGYRAEVEEHHRQYEVWKANNAEVRSKRDSEPTTACVNPHLVGGTCGAQLPRGDYRCFACGALNPAYVDRGIEAILWGDA